jgi:hypothetical protein
MGVSFDLEYARFLMMALETMLINLGQPDSRVNWANR